MKQKIGIVLTACFMLLFPGCEDFYQTTTVYNDGSLQREVEIVSDDPQLGRSLLPFPRGQAWSYSTSSGKEGDHVRYRFKVVGRFKDSGELNAEMERARQKNQIRSQVDLQKKWRGFYIHYRYTEVFPAHFPFRKVEMSKYFSPDELSLLLNAFTDYTVEKLTKDDPQLVKRLEEKFNNWYRRTVGEEFFALLLQAVAKSGDKKLTPQWLEGKKDALLAKALVVIEALDTIPAEKLMAKCAEVLGAPGLLGVYERQKSLFAAFDDKMGMLGSGVVSCTVTVRLPGVVTAVRYGKVKGNEVAWEVDHLRFLFRDFQVLAESRRLNRTLVWLAGLLAAAVLAFLVAGLVRVRRRRRVL